MNALPMKSLLLSSTCLWVSATCAWAEAPDLSSPKNAATEYYRALLNADLEAVKATVTDDANSRRCVERQVASIAAHIRLHRAAEARWGSSGGEVFPSPDPNRALAEIAKAEAVIDGQTATLGEGPGPLKFRNIGGKWKIDLSGFTPEPNAVVNPALVMADEIAADKYHGIWDAREAYIARLPLPKALPESVKRTILPRPWKADLTNPKSAAVTFLAALADMDANAAQYAAVRNEINAKVIAAYASYGRKSAAFNSALLLRWGSAAMRVTSQSFINEMAARYYHDAKVTTDGNNAVVSFSTDAFFWLTSIPLMKDGDSWRVDLPSNTVLSAMLVEKIGAPYQGIASQVSEGKFATWQEAKDALEVALKSALGAAMGMPASRSQ